MTVLVFLLSLLLLAAGAAAGYMSIDLLPTAPGLLYAFAGAVAVVAAIVVFALGVLIARVGRLTSALREQAAADALAAPPAPVEEAAALSPVARVVEPTGTGPEVEAAVAEPQEAEPEAELANEAPVGEARGPERDAESRSGEPVNVNRSGRLPTLGEIERAIETPEPPPTLIGRYASGGANYMIFSDGSIEAETDEGAFKFASMGDFKDFLVDRNARKPS